MREEGGRGGGGRGGRKEEEGGGGRGGGEGEKPFSPFCILLQQLELANTVTGVVFPPLRGTGVITKIL